MEHANAYATNKNTLTGSECVDECSDPEAGPGWKA